MYNSVNMYNSVMYNSVHDSHVQLCQLGTTMLYNSVQHSVMYNSATPWTVACQAPQSMEFSRLEYWSG